MNRINREPRPLKTIEGHHQRNPDGSITCVGLRENGSFFQSTSIMVGRVERLVDLFIPGNLQEAFEVLKAGGKVEVVHEHH